jgi:hypothetical protein
MAGGVKECYHGSRKSLTLLSPVEPEVPGNNGADNAEGVDDTADELHILPPQEGIRTKLVMEEAAHVLQTELTLMPEMLRQYPKGACWYIITMVLVA